MAMSIAMSTSAQHVIDRLGGFREVADFLGVHKSRVHRWTYPRDRGGTGGVIPQRHFGKLMDMAQKRGVDLQADDLVGRAA